MGQQLVKMCRLLCCREGHTSYLTRKEAGLGGEDEKREMKEASGALKTPSSVEASFA